MSRKHFSRARIVTDRSNQLNLLLSIPLSCALKRWMRTELSGSSMRTWLSNLWTKESSSGFDGLGFK